MPFTVSSQHRAGPDRKRRKRPQTRNRRVNAYQRDTMTQLAAVAHSDSTAAPKQEARRMHVADRTARRWSTHGPPQVRQIALYLHDHPAPHRIIAHLRAMAESDIRERTKDELIREYRDLLVTECDVEAEDRKGTVSGTSWLDIAAQSERDAAVDLRKAAIEREFAARRIGRDEVLHG